MLGALFYASYFFFSLIFFWTDEGRRWQRFSRLQLYYMKCWRRFYLMGNLILTYNFTWFLFPSFYASGKTQMIFNWSFHYRQKDMSKMLREEKNSMNNIQLELNRRLWNFLRLLKYSLYNTMNTSLCIFGFLCSLNLVLLIQWYRSSQQFKPYVMWVICLYSNQIPASQVVAVQ